MKKISIGVLLLVILFAIAACSGNKQNGENADETKENQVSDEKLAEKPVQEPTETPDLNLTAVNMLEQGNPKKIYLTDIAEINNDVANAWIKLSTQFDPTLSLYHYDSLAIGTKAIAVTFAVTNFDAGEATLYWCYQLKSGEKTISIWDTSSPTDTLSITGDGTYQMVFDVEAALGGTLDVIESLQIVFPCGSETTSTIVSISKLLCITDVDELQYFSTGKTE